MPAIDVLPAHDAVVSPPQSASRLLRPLLLRIHFYAGVLIGPFLLVSALTGLLYTVAPQLDQLLYGHELHVSAGTDRLPLAAQVAAAHESQPQGMLESVRPAATVDGTTRVSFLVDGYSRTVFVDPYTAKVRGDLRTSGEWLPARAFLDSLHRTLLLGNTGRIYSELSASWLWVIVICGLALWIGKQSRRVRGSGRSRMVNRHSVLGMWLAAGLLFLSATGLTWSHFAGNNIDRIRTAVGSGTPVVSTDSPAARPHADIGFDGAMDAATRAGLSDPVEITPPGANGSAYVVKQVKRSWPEKQDSMAIDAGTGTVLHTLRFSDYPLLAKLSRWGIDAHMGLLFGPVNQIALAAVAIGVILLVCWGYRMWWLRGRVGFGRLPASGAWRQLPVRILIPLIVGVAGVGYLFPLLGISLLAFLAIDVVLGRMRSWRHPVHSSAS